MSESFPVKPASLVATGSCDSHFSFPVLLLQVQEDHFLKELCVLVISSGSLSVLSKFLHLCNTDAVLTEVVVLVAQTGTADIITVDCTLVDSFLAILCSN